MTTGTVLKKVLKHGHIELEIPQQMSVESAMATYQTSYPELAFASVRDAGIQDNKQVFEVYREQKVGTKG